MTSTKAPAGRGYGLFLAGDPGGAAALRPVIEAWKARKRVYAYRQAGTLLLGGEWEVAPLDDHEASSAIAEALLEMERPLFVCAATSVNGVDWERHFFRAARKLKIPSFAILDYWSNYAIRFSLERPLDALPDMITVVDERMRTEMMATGFPSDLLRITGQPVLDEARRWHGALPDGSRDRFRAEFGFASETRVVLFVSQPLREMRESVGADASPADDEFASLRKLAEAITQGPPSAAMLLVIKMHPREEPNKFQALIPTLPCPVRVAEAPHHRWEMCVAADAIFGMDSMLLEEARAMGRPVERILPERPIHLNGSQASPAGRDASDARPAAIVIAEMLAHEFRASR